MFLITRTSFSIWLIEINVMGTPAVAICFVNLSLDKT